MLWYVPIEPYRGRYPADWYRWFPEGFKKHNIPYTIIDGQSFSGEVTAENFLNVYSSTHYSLTQLQEITRQISIGKVKDGDIFFIGDIGFPGGIVETIRRLLDLSHIKAKVYGFLHAGSYCTEDIFTPFEHYQKHFELGWLEACDGIFVGTYYHKNKIVQKRLSNYRQELSEKIYVTGVPWRVEEAQKIVGNYQKKQQVIFPSRLSQQRRPDVFIQLARLIHKEHPKISFVITSPSEYKNNVYKLPDADTISFVKVKNREEYLQKMAESKIMFSSSVEETFGYGVIEAETFNTIPLCPNRCSYPELVPKKYLYNSLDEAAKKIPELLDGSTPNLLPFAKIYETTIDRIIGWMI